MTFCSFKWLHKLDSPWQEIIRCLFTWSTLPRAPVRRPVAAPPSTSTRTGSSWESVDDLILRTYSLVGLRADVDFMLWRIAFDPLCFQSMEATIRRSRLGAYLSQVHSFLSLQRRSQYVNRMKGAGEGVELLPGEGKYLFVYPFTKTRSWYRLSPHARQGMMDEHIAASAPFKGVHLNTSYSYGIDDQDFMVAFDSDYPQEFVDLVGRLRYTEASLYTQRDTPMFTCAKAPIDAILAQLANMD